jgi:hypothetical protein
MLLEALSQVQDLKTQIADTPLQQMPKSVGRAAEGSLLADAAATAEAGEVKQMLEKLKMLILTRGKPFVKDIQDLLPKAAHVKAQLSPVLESFELLQGCVEDINGPEARAAELAIQNDPRDAAVKVALLTRSNLMEERYRVEIEKRLNVSGRTLLWIRVCRAGNDSFREVYETVWENTIVINEGKSIERYVLLTEEMRKLAANPSIVNQCCSTFPDLYVLAAMIKTKFGKLMTSVRDKFEGRFKRELVIVVCPTLKKVSRMVEKGQLKPSSEAESITGVKGSIAEVKDIVRAMVTGHTMEDVNGVIEILMELHKEEALEIVRVKDRFISEPSSGGWRDQMVNVCLVDENGSKHICEIQIVHRMMLNARKEMAGHDVYNVVRNVLEMMHMSRGSTDAAALGDFVPDLEHPPAHLTNWLTDLPVSEWKGVTGSNDKGEVLGIDLHAVDPELTARHRLPNLEQLSFRGFERVGQKYLQQLAKGYKRHKKRCVDFRGVAELNDDSLRVLSDAGVQWSNLDLGGTNVTEAGILGLAKDNPNMLVR